MHGNEYSADALLCRQFALPPLASASENELVRLATAARGPKLNITPRQHSEVQRPQLIHGPSAVCILHSSFLIKRAWSTAPIREGSAVRGRRGLCAGPSPRRRMPPPRPDRAPAMGRGTGGNQVPDYVRAAVTSSVGDPTPSRASGEKYRGGRCCVQPILKIIGLPAVPAPVRFTRQRSGRQAAVAGQR
jgi:hypothetical protein